MGVKESFIRHQGQTTPYPLAIDVESAKGMYVTDKSGKVYLDMVARTMLLPPMILPITT